MNNSLQRLESALAYRFADRNLLKQALSHRSVGGINNERLEFLGDSVLNTVISAHLFSQHGHLDEGTLTRLRASLVNQNMLASLAGELDLGEYLSLGPGELKSGGQRRASILADALEALFGAIYLDGGFEKLQKTVIKLFKHHLESPVMERTLKDSKTRLQEELQARSLPLPSYKLEYVTGQDHQQVFHVSCTISALDLYAEGVASSRKAAEQAAAQHVLGNLTDA